MEKASEHINAAKSYYKKKQFDKAEQEARTAIEAAEPVQTERFCLLQNIRAIMAIRKTRKILTKLARKNPNAHSGALAVTYYKLGLVYLRIKLVKSAISNLTFAGELYKRQQKPDYEALADIYRILGEHYGRKYSAHYLGESIRFAALIDDARARALCEADIQATYGSYYAKCKDYVNAERSYSAAGEAYSVIYDETAGGTERYLIEYVTNFLNAAIAAQKQGENERAHDYARRAGYILHYCPAPEGRKKEGARLRKLAERVLEK